jgi:hypothetical protein
MNASADQIHTALQKVADLRRARASDSVLTRASLDLRRFQADRFRATYADLLQSERYSAAAKFFLGELYGEKDYSQRDRQFDRIAGTIARIFPKPVISTAAALAEVHALTEGLDDRMARQWMLPSPLKQLESDHARYVRCWHEVGDQAARARQLDVVSELGHSLNRLTRMPGLRTMLRMMRRPAAAAGLESLQLFLEAGFDAFSHMRGADEFLMIIREREVSWMAALFGVDRVGCEIKLAALMEPPQNSSAADRDSAG